MLELPYYNTFFKTSTPPAVELTQILAEMTPGNLNHVFYGRLAPTPTIPSPA